MTISALRYRRTETQLGFIALSVSLMAYVLIPTLEDVLLLESAAIIVAILVPLLFLRFCYSLFLDRQLLFFEMDNYWLLVSLLYVLVSYIAYGLNLVGLTQSTSYILLFYLSYLMRMAFLAASMLTIMSHWNTDLVAKRRSLRIILLGAGGVYMLLVLVVETTMRSQDPPSWLEALNATGLAIFFLTLASWFITSNPEDLFEKRAPSDQASKAPNPELTMTEQKWMADISHQLETKAIYRQNGLSINELARNVGIPEHRLRKLINEQLGFRNFNEFLNHYRLKEVEARLSDPEFEETPVLTLALESGFNSITPFNRAFKARHHCTPTDYRKQKLRS